jgi:fermentation-respiration switch protein FrsA (DUF1100 family)
MQTRMKTTLRRMLLVVVILYMAFLLNALFLADREIFLPRPSSYKETPEILKLRSANGNKISAIYLPNPSATYTLLVSHGNAEDLGDGRYWLNDLRNAGFNVLAYDYQGYGTSEGKPSEKRAYEDESAAYDYLTINLKTPPDRIIILGRSVGTGPAVYLAARKPAAGLVLQSPFLSAFRVLTGIPILPFDKFPNARDIGKVHCPVLIIHGTADRVIGIWHGRKLFALANEPKQSLWVEGADHNDLEIVAGAQYIRAVQNFAASLKSSGMDSSS